MRFEDFIRNGQVRTARQDISLIKSIISTSKMDLSFLGKLEINKESARKIMSNYYDVLRSILEAIAAKYGYKIYSHEAFTFFLEEQWENIIAEKFERFRKIRNGINYYGASISVEEVKEYVPEIKKLIKLLIEKYLEHL